MKGITVATPDWLDLADEAARRWTQHTGLPARIVEAATKSAARDAKLIMEEACWFFDADLWLVRDVSLPELCACCVFGTPVVPSVRGRELIREWARRSQVDPACWISGGFYGSDWSAPRPRAALALARRHAEEWTIADRDEEPLNVGFQRAELPVALLPSAFNWHPRCGNGYGYTPPAGIIAIHAGDVPSAEKWEFLTRHAGAVEDVRQVDSQPLAITNCEP